MVRTFQLCAGAIAVGALVVQFALLLERMSGDIGATALRFISYFTLLSNVVGATAFLAPAIAPLSSLGRFLSRPAMRTAATLYLLVVGVVYHAVLASRWDPQGWQLAVDVALHTITPIAMAADWLFFTAKRDLRLETVFPSLIFPAGYGAFAVAQGAINGFYPYPFIDVGALGYPRVALNLAILLALFGGLGSVMVLAGRRFFVGPRGTVT